METKSGWASKINWAQAIGVLATVLAIFGFDMDPETQIGVVAGINGVMAVVTWIMRTWYTDKLIA